MRRFPDCQCDQNISNSPYRIEILNRTSTGAGGTFCFNLYTAPCDTGSPCCSTQLYKIALPVRECRVKGGGHEALDHSASIDSVICVGHASGVRISGMYVVMEQEED